jgi:hypothetical protein
MARGQKTGGRKKGALNKVTAPVKLAIKALFEPYAPEAVKTLVGIMRDENAPQTTRILASKEVLDRVYGKSRETHRHEGLEPAKLAVIQISSQAEMRALLGPVDVDAGTDDDDSDEGES